MTDSSYQICTRCIMDTSAQNISFDAAGVCNFCTEFLDRSGHMLAQTDPHKREQELKAFVAKVQKDGQGKRYDCIIGVSGGVDSSWALVLALQYGLRPLAVHMDNGWNSELAQNNIANLVRELGVDLYTHVIDWQEYRKLMQAFFDAGVIDIELLYDNAMAAVNYQQAAKYGIKYILAGTNQATEGMRMPQGWNHMKYDKRNIKAIAKKFGNVRIDTFPSLGVLKFAWYEFVRGNKWISFLDYFEYNKAQVLDSLERDFGYKRYPYKHYESVFTRFYQGYILVNKFGVDKRRIHFSTLVAVKQMTRDEALTNVAGLAYPSERELEQDKQYFLKKMGWSADQLEAYINAPGGLHADYPSEEPLYEFLLKIYRRYLKK